MSYTSIARFHPVAGIMLLVMAGGVDTAMAEGCMARAQYGLGLLGPATYASQSGVYALEVDPNDPMPLGRYGAAYRFSAEGKRVWSGERPYTLREVVITDTGAVVGFAYRSELEATGGRPDPRKYLHIVIIDRFGNEILNDVTERPPRRFAYSPPLPPFPYVQQLIVDSDNDRIVVRIVGPSETSGMSSWWIYRLSTGGLLQRFDPEVLTMGSSGAAWVQHAQPVLETPLMLVHCVMLDRPVSSVPCGTRFALIDLHGKCVWSLDLKGDCTALKERVAKRDHLGYIFGGNPLLRYFGGHPAILRSGSPKRFEIRSFANNERIGFSIDKDNSGSWVVSEVSRVKYEEPAG